MISPRRRPWLAFLAGIAFAVCKPEHEHEHAEHEEGDAQGHPDEAREAHDDPENRVRIDPSMLRDLRLTTQAAESRPAGDAVTVLGELRVNEDAYAEIGTSTPARVLQVLAAPGDPVEAGQPLVELDSPDVGRARAAILTARARLGLARTTVERRRGLAADQIVPMRELQAAEAELAEAEAESRAAEQSLAALGGGRGTGSRFVLSSPIEGTVIDRTALRGRLVDAQTPLFVVGDLRRLWLVVHAFERDALRMATGKTASVTFPALPGQRDSGTVTKIATHVDPASRTVDVRIEIANPSGQLRPGMSAVASVPIGESTETVVTVPVEAIQRQSQGWCVFIPLGEDGLFELRPVGRGRDLGGEVEIVSGLAAGEPVVVDGAFLIKAEAEKARGGADQHHHH